MLRCKDAVVPKQFTCVDKQELISKLLENGVLPTKAKLIAQFAEQNGSHVVVGTRLYKVGTSN